ncbi:dipeptidase [Flavitalea sp.]|nr:membrane dipeptidase [Flavitalea sp.]
MKFNRRDFLVKTSIVSAGMSIGMPAIASVVGTPVVGAPVRKGPKDYAIVIGHADIWEFNARFKLKKKEQNSPLRDFLLPRLLEGGISVYVMPATGDSTAERQGSDQVLEGALRVIDMFHTEIAKTNGKASLILTKKDVPTAFNPNNVKFFLDMEGAASIEVDPEPTEYYPGCDLAVLRNFFRLGVRGLQLTHNGRNQVADGIGEGKMAGKLSKFGVSVVQELNRLGMMVGVSHLSANGIYHAAEVSTKPIVSSHQNPQKFINTPLQHSDDEIKAIAKTGGLMGMRYTEGETTYKMCADIIDYVANLVGIDHVGVGWLGHDKGNPSPNFIPGYSTGAFPGGEIEKLTKYEQCSRFIDMLYERKYSDENVAKVMGGNFLRIMKETLPE